MRLTTVSVETDKEEIEATWACRDETCKKLVEIVAADKFEGVLFNKSEIEYPLMELITAVAVLSALVVKLLTDTVAVLNELAVMLETDIFPEEI